MNSPANSDSETEELSPATEIASHHPDPLTGEPDAHPVGVGLGASAAGAAGAVIGAVLGPVGAIIGAAIGAVAGGLAGKEVATLNDVPDSVVEEDPFPPSQASAVEEPGLPDRIGAFAENQEQLASPAFDRLSRDVGYKDAHEAEPKSASALPRDVVPAPYEVAEPGDKEYATTHRGGEIPESAAAQPPVPTIGDNPYTISDLPLAVDAFSTGNPTHEPLVLESDTEAAIRELAYHKYLARVENGMPGDDVADWAEAENEVLHRA